MRIFISQVLKQLPSEDNGSFRASRLFFMLLVAVRLDAALKAGDPGAIRVSMFRMRGDFFIRPPEASLDKNHF
jgi:hypothetical protein